MTQDVEGPALTSAVPGPRTATASSNTHISAKDYIAAVQHPAEAFTIDRLQSAEFPVGLLGVPTPFSGSAAVVFKARLEDRDVALRFYIRPRVSSAPRYRALMQHCHATGLSDRIALVRWHDDAVIVGTRRWPVLEMEWVVGQTLRGYLDDLVEDGDVEGIARLAVEWRALVARLQEAEFAHGDLSGDNVLVESGGALRLVDLDGCWCPSLADSSVPDEVGNFAFQHRRRAWGRRMDTFPALVILTSLLALARSPELWNAGWHDQTNLLFTRVDLADTGTPLWAALAAIEGAELQRSLSRLREAAAADRAPDTTLEEILTQSRPVSGKDDWWTDDRRTTSKPDFETPSLPEPPDRVSDPDPDPGPRPTPRRGALLTVLTALVIGAAGTTVAVLGWPTADPVPTPTQSAPALQSRPLPVALTWPTGLAAGPDGRHLYVTDSETNALDVIDAASGNLETAIPVGSAPGDVALSPSGRLAYITNRGFASRPGATVSVVDLAADRVSATVVVGGEPSGAAVSPDGAFVYVTTTNRTPVGSNLTVIDAATNTVATTVPTGAPAGQPAVSSDGTQVFVPARTATGPTLEAIDVRSHAISFAHLGDNNPTRAIWTPGDVAVICNGNAGSVGSVQWVRSVRGVLAVTSSGSPDTGPSDFARSNDGRTFAVTNWGSDSAPGATVSITDTTGYTTRAVPVDGRPLRAVFDPTGRFLWVLTLYPGGISRIPVG